MTGPTRLFLGKRMIQAKFSESENIPTQMLRGEPLYKRGALSPTSGKIMVRQIRQQLASRAQDHLTSPKVSCSVTPSALIKLCHTLQWSGRLLLAL